MKVLNWHFFMGHPRYGEILNFGTVEKTRGLLQIFDLLCSNAHRKAKSYPLAFDRAVGQENWSRTSENIAIYFRVVTYGSPCIS